MASVLVPLPERDFDPTEVAVSWKVLVALGHTVVFATPSGAPAAPDEMMMSGRGLDPWGFVPLVRDLPAIGLVLRANGDGRRAMRELQADGAYRAPITWDAAGTADADGLLLPGGHRARGMRQYLESAVLQRLAVEWFVADRPVAAICHGVLLAARSTDPATGRSVLHGRRTTALTWSMEQTAWRLTRLSRFWDPSYYRTYRESAGQPAGYMSVQQEVTRALAAPDDFVDVPPSDPLRRLRNGGRARDTLEDDRPAWVVRDGSYISARWPGDAHTFAKQFAEVLEEFTTGRRDDAAS
jgi:putative intracellular protease/amidase